jgi:hypothetical protein
MSTGPVAPTQPEPAEGPSEDEPAAGKGEGISAPDPAEGSDDAPAGGDGSPR